MPAKRILCVDDNGDTCELPRTMLGMADLDVVTVPGVDGALRLIGSERFDLYVLDSEIPPGSSGLTLCHNIGIRDDVPGSA